MLLRTAMSQKPVVGCPGLKTESPLESDIGLWLKIRFLRINIINIEDKTQTRAATVTP